MTAKDLEIQELRRALKRYEDAEEGGRLVVLPCKVGDKIWVLETDEYGNPDDCTSWILIGGNYDFAFLSPIIGGTDNAIDICYEFYDRSITYDDLPICVIPWTQVYPIREEAEAALEEVRADEMQI